MIFSLRSPRSSAVFCFLTSLGILYTYVHFEVMPFFEFSQIIFSGIFSIFFLGLDLLVFGFSIILMFVAGWYAIFSHDGMIRYPRFFRSLPLINILLLPYLFFSALKDSSGAELGGLAVLGYGIIFGLVNLIATLIIARISSQQLKQQSSATLFSAPETLSKVFRTAAVLQVVLGLAIFLIFLLAAMLHFQKEQPTKADQATKMADAESIAQSFNEITRLSIGTSTAENLQGILHATPLSDKSYLQVKSITADSVQSQIQTKLKSYVGFSYGAGNDPYNQNSYNLGLRDSLLNVERVCGKKSPLKNCGIWQAQDIII